MFPESSELWEIIDDKNLFEEIGQRGIIYSRNGENYNEL